MQPGIPGLESLAGVPVCGAAALAGLSCGFWRDMDEIAALRRSQRMFLPERPQADCDAYYRLWKRAVSRAADWIEH